MATWPNTIVLVHGYAASANAKANAAKGAGRVDDFWYWTGTYSDGKETYNVPQDLSNAAARDEAQVLIVAANWDGVTKIETSVEYLVNVLDRYCTGSNTCELVGHSTGDALIGYALDKFQAQKSWNIRTVFVAGGAGGGTEAASWASYFTDPNSELIQELRPVNIRNLYNHNMWGKYAVVPNIRFVGAGTKYDSVNDISYSEGALLCRGQSDGLVPFHSQGGVSEYIGDYYNQAYDAYCIECHTGGVYSCGQLNLGDSPAKRWTYEKYEDVPVFAGFRVQMIDKDLLYNHSDEVGRLAEWIIRYKRDQTPWYSGKSG